MGRMDFPDTIIRIIEENKCPMYNPGDEFNVNGTALLMPPGRPVCLILVRDITDFFAKNRKSEDEFDCSGCSGQIRLAYKREFAFRLPPPKKSADELAALTRLLGKFEMFQALSGNQVKEVVSLLRIKKYAAGDFVIRKGEYGRHLYIIASGATEVLGEEGIRVAQLKSGEVCGEMSLLSGEPTGASVRVIKPAMLLYISGKDFREILSRYPSLQMYFTQLLARRLAAINNARAEEFTSGMIGKLREMPPSELFQILNSNLKTGVLTLELPQGIAKISFREGELIRVRYNKQDGIDAFFAILKETRGRFRFMRGLNKEDMEAEPIGDFMWLLMEGVNKIDEAQ